MQIKGWRKKRGTDRNVYRRQTRECEMSSADKTWHTLREGSPWRWAEKETIWCSIALSQRLSRLTKWLVCSILEKWLDLIRNLTLEKDDSSWEWSVTIIISCWGWWGTYLYMAAGQCLCHETSGTLAFFLLFIAKQGHFSALVKQVQKKLQSALASSDTMTSLLQTQFDLIKTYFVYTVNWCFIY